MASTAGPPQTPTEDTPVIGTIRHTKYGITLCSVVQWVEPDGSYVVRAQDFDLIAVGEDRRDAVRKFVDEVYSLYGALGELVEQEHVTAEEKDLFVRIATPLAEATRRRQEETEARFIEIRFPRLMRKRGDDRSHAWSSVSSPTRSGPLSVA